MGFNVLILADAFKDIDKAVDYYYNTSPKLASRFAKELNKSLKILHKKPFFEIRYKDYRVLPLKTFPYILVFTVHEKSEKVEIYAVFHTSRDPEKLPK